MKKGKIGCLVGVITLGVLAICIITGFAWIGIQEYKDTPRLVSEIDFGQYALEEYSYSADQIDAINESGYPESFTILFFHTVDPEGKKVYVRHEEWAYPTTGDSLIFENGYLIAENSTEPYPAIPTRYQPASFTAFTKREALAQAAGIDEWFILPVEEELLYDADLYFAEGFTFGLQAGELVYIEAVGFEEPDAAGREVPAKPHSLSLSTNVLAAPAGRIQTKSSSGDHPIDQAILLMFSSHMRMNGEVESVYVTSARMAVLSQQVGSGNEIDALIQLYTEQINMLRAGDDYDPELEARLVDELEAKVVELQKQAQALAAQRNQPRRRGGLNRIFNWLGRQTGKIVGGAMDGAGKIGVFAIEEVAPRVLKEAVQGGAPLNAALVRQVARKLLFNRVGEAIYNHQYRRAARLANIDDNLDPIADATFEANFMEAFEEDEEGQILGADIDPDPTSTGIEDGGTGGSGITEKRPVRFTNNGFNSVTVVVQSYEPAPGLNAGIPAASTVVAPETNSSAYLELPLGTYTFCYFWQLDEDYNNDDYLDYYHRITSAYTLSNNSSKDMQSAIAVTLSPESNVSNPNGRCGQAAPDNSDLTPEELVNQGTHQWLATCIGNDEYCDGTTEIVTGTITFSNGTVIINDGSEDPDVLIHVGLNTYTWTTEYDVWTYIFTMEGFELSVDFTHGKLVYTLQN